MACPERNRMDIVGKGPRPGLLCYGEVRMHKVVLESLAWEDVDHPSHIEALLAARYGASVMRIAPECLHP